MCAKIRNSWQTGDFTLIWFKDALEVEDLTRNEVLQNFKCVHVCAYVCVCVYAIFLSCVHEFDT